MTVARRSGGVCLESNEVAALAMDRSSDAFFFSVASRDGESLREVPAAADYVSRTAAQLTTHCRMERARVSGLQGHVALLDVVPSELPGPSAQLRHFETCGMPCAARLLRERSRSFGHVVSVR